MKKRRSSHLQWLILCTLLICACDPASVREVAEDARTPVTKSDPDPSLSTEPIPVKPAPVQQTPIDEDKRPDNGEYPPIEEHLEISPSWKRLGKDEIWIDREKHQVIVGGHICLRAGALEMFACPQHTKEHESVVSVHTSSKFVHAALLAVGAKPGTAVQFEPEYKPATGPIVKVTIRWMEDGKLQERPAQQMVRDIAADKPMAHDWVFVGSTTWTNPDTGEVVYLGDNGELICVSNFGSATMDLPVKSSSEAYDLLFEALTDNIPNLGTLVLLVLEPEVSASTESTNSAPADSPNK